MTKRLGEMEQARELRGFLSGVRQRDCCFVSSVELSELILLHTLTHTQQYLALARTLPSFTLPVDDAAKTRPQGLRSRRFQTRLGVCS